MQRHAQQRARTLLVASLVFAGLAIAHAPAHAQAYVSTGTRAVPTYEAAGLYWSAPGATVANGCEVKFRKAGTTAWTQGLSMWFDSRDNECRGSLVSLVPGTTYEAQFNLPGQPVTRAITFTTWANQLPVARTVKVASGAGTLNISQGGSAASGYVVYDGTGATLDALNASQYNITVNAPFVIVRGFTLKGAQQDAIRISADVKDVVIEDNDISGWGRTRDGTWGADMDSAVRAVCKTETLERVTIQRNKMHDPRYSANSWSDGHPAGPQGVTISYCGGNHVIRHNEIYGGGKHFNDGIGGEDNFSKTGFPNADSDIYGNRISNTWDDGIEAEGGNKNVRIWGNYMDNTATGVATTTTAIGPVYIFRNVFNRNQFYERKSHDQDDRQPFFKSGSDSSLGNGRRYVFHNTMLQATETGSSNGRGGGAGMGGTGASQLINNTVSMNNIYHLWKANSAFYQVGTDNQFQNDMFNGNAGAAMVSGINATPTYAAGNGWKSESNGLYALAAGTPGYDKGVRIPNFNDAFNGAGPDVGAVEAGASAMAFGLEAGSSVAQSPNNTAPSTTVTPTTQGSASTSSGMDSSRYTIASGESVTFTATLMGNSGTPTGTVNFQANGATIAGCGSIAVSSGKALCTTSSLGGGSYKITGVYSGNATYSAAQAGPITETVTGAAAAAALPTKFGIDSSSYTINAGQGVTFTAAIPGNGGTVAFQDNGVAIAGCGAVAVVNGSAKCTTASLAAGSHPVRGYYSGSGSYSAGIAGPITQTVR
jgi:hypothetical protein